MLKDLELPSLQQRREFNKLVFLFKIAGCMVLAINSDYYFKSQRQKRTIKAKQFSDYQILKYSRENVTNISRCFIVDNYRSDQFRYYSFFIDSVIKWNHLPESIVHAETAESFKSRLTLRALSRSIRPFSVTADITICPLSDTYCGLLLRGAMSAVTGIYLFRLLLNIVFLS